MKEKATALEEKNIRPHQIQVGHFMHFLYVPKVDSVEHCENFYLWLKGKGINACRDAIVRAVAEKSNIFFPGELRPSPPIYGFRYMFRVSWLPVAYRPSCICLTALCFPTR